MTVRSANEESINAIWPSCGPCQDPAWCGEYAEKPRKGDSPMTYDAEDAYKVEQLLDAIRADVLALRELNEHSRTATQPYICHECAGEWPCESEQLFESLLAKTTRTGIQYS